MGTLLDESITWAEFGKRHLDRRISKAITDSLGLERPTLVQSQGIPVALAGQDLLCRARTGSGKTLCYSVPMVQRLLGSAEAQGSSTPLAGVILVPTKELIAQVHGVLVALITFCFDVLAVEQLLSGQNYGKAELPSILVTTPSSLAGLVEQRRGTMLPLAEALKILVIDEADLMFSFGYEEDVRSLCAMLPSSYQAMLVSATLSAEVEQLKGLMLHKPVILKLEEPRVTGKLSQFYFVCHRDDKYLILYTLLKLQLLQGKTLMFVNNIEDAYRMRIFLERFSINSAVLNAELPHATRQHIIEAFNQGSVELLIATDVGVAGRLPDDEEEEAAGGGEAKEAAEPLKKARKRKKQLVSQADGDVGGTCADGQPESKELPKKKRRKKQTAVAEGGTDEGCNPEEEAKNRATTEGSEAAAAGEAEAESKSGKKGKAAKAKAKAKAEAEASATNASGATVALQRSAGSRFARKRRLKADEQYSLTRGVDLQGVTSVINVSVPTTVRDYVHRVGRCARGGASGTALTLCSFEEEPAMQQVIRAQAASGGLGEVKPLPLQLSDAERFRYRVEDQTRGLTKRVIEKYRARELQLEALHSEKLKAYFEENPGDKRALHRMQRSLRQSKAIKENLKHLPSYLVPDTILAATPVQQAVREAAALEGKASPAVQKRRYLQAKRKDPLQAATAPPPQVRGRKRSLNATRAAMEAKAQRQDPATTNVAQLPPLSGGKLWKLRHGKRVRPILNQLGEKRSVRNETARRMRKFGF